MAEYEGRMKAVSRQYEGTSSRTAISSEKSCSGGSDPREMTSSREGGNKLQGGRIFTYAASLQNAPPPPLERTPSSLEFIENPYGNPRVISNGPPENFLGIHIEFLEVGNPQSY